jgi:hypothetical protein
MNASQRNDMPGTQFWPMTAFRNRGSPQLAGAVTAKISQNINPPRTGHGPQWEA